VAAAQTPATWQVSRAVQTTPAHLSVAGTQTPPVQAPPVQSVPSGAAGLEQTPVAAAQVPATWQASSAAQKTAAHLSGGGGAAFSLQAAAPTTNRTSK
jgi:hypothetical protein